ncbi:hypothetical protein L3X38_003100 [Prunus dulcis]|uniref:Uncharacterized protein n=1 Tax=Prunus dulcis TaxID=3755 RepID=A0AAD4WYK0_PRUDU|nr:hypothetical protein L3X38_003100 [Prunus dulcis]
MNMDQGGGGSSRNQVKKVSTFLTIQLLEVNAPRLLGSAELATPDLTKAPAVAASYNLGEEEAEPKLA